MKIALCQMEIRLYDPEYNLKTMLNMLDVSADLYVFPETCLTGFDGTPKILDIGDLEEYHVEIAKSGKNVMFGSVVERENVAILTLNGKIEDRYSKTHLFSHADEDRVFKAGNALKIWDIQGMLIFPQICYDLRFPAEIYTHAEKSDILIFIANWPAERIDHWDSLLKARAIENQRFVIGVNCVGSHRWRYVGHSAVYDPWGRRIAFLGEEEKVEVVEIDLSLLSKVIESFNTRRDFRVGLLGSGGL